MSAGGHLSFYDDMLTGGKSFQVISLMSSGNCLFEQRAFAGKGIFLKLEEHFLDVLMVHSVIGSEGGLDDLLSDYQH
jgi:hypothetical protein